MLSRSSAGVPACWARPIAASATRRVRLAGTRVARSAAASNRRGQRRRPPAWEMADGAAEGDRCPAGTPSRIQKSVAVAVTGKPAWISTRWPMRAARPASQHDPRLPVSAIRQGAHAAGQRGAHQGGKGEQAEGAGGDQRVEDQVVRAIHQHGASLQVDQPGRVDRGEDLPEGLQTVAQEGSRGDQGPRRAPDGRARAEGAREAGHEGERDQPAQQSCGAHAGDGDGGLTISPGPGNAQEKRRRPPPLLRARQPGSSPRPGRSPGTPSGQCRPRVGLGHVPVRRQPARCRRT